MTIEDDLNKIKETVLKERKISAEFISLLGSSDSKDEKELNLINLQTNRLKDSLKKINDELLKNLEKMNISIPLSNSKNMNLVVSNPEIKNTPNKKEEAEYKKNFSELDMEILKRLKKEKEKKVEKNEEKKINPYTKFAGDHFSNLGKFLISKKIFKKIGDDLIKSHLDYNLITYLPVLALNVIISFIIAILLFLFLLFFNISATFPIVTMATGNLGIRALELFWMIFVIPIGTFLFMYSYPSFEKKSLGSKIDAELPFAAIHMSAISGSLIDPTKIFSIISSTKEYPHLEKEFNKLLNEINIYGYDLVTALKDSAINSPSIKLSELLNGLATTITSGGSLYEFFEKRSQSLLFDYSLEKEKATKSAETFMDIYISVVIAAPMIFMLLLMMIKISGLGISLSTSMISFLVAGGVSLINIFFLVFLQLKQSSTA